MHIKERKLIGMKSHDCHVLLQRFLPLAIRGILPTEVCDALVGLCIFFSDLCSKSLRIEDLKILDKHIAITLCRLEMIFPPSFFDIMVHLPVHLAGEAMVAGPVQYRWMYPIERSVCSLILFIFYGIIMLLILIMYHYINIYVGIYAL